MLLYIFGHSFYLIAQNDISEGESFFEFQCSACHTIGEGAIVGPDLLGITQKREHAWLVRKIVEPYQMYQEGDSITVENVEQYGEPMYPQGLTEEDALNVIAYLEEVAIDPLLEEDDDNDTTFNYLFAFIIGVIIIVAAIAGFKFLRN